MPPDVHRYESLLAAAGPVSRETFSALMRYGETVRRWSPRINLVAPSTLGTIWERHILDGAQLLPLAGGARRWLDIGSGGGFPGAVIALLLADHPGGVVHLVESNRKKVAFLHAALAGERHAARIHPVRLETLSVGEEVEIVTARAVAPLPVLLGLARPWLATGARGLFHKGRDFAREIEESRRAWHYDLIEHPSRIGDGSVILEIANLSPLRTTGLPADSQGTEGP